MSVNKFHTGQPVFVRKDEDDKTINKSGRVTRILTDGVRAWIELDTQPASKVLAYPEDCDPATDRGVGNRAERRKAAQTAAEPVPTMADFGKDHWSTFGYIETRCVDHGGSPQRESMRCHANRHPMLVGRNGDGSAHPTRLKGDKTLTHHDDWDCVDDLAREGLLENLGSAVNPRYRLTPRGRAIAAQLRAHKEAGGNFGAFTPKDES